MKNLYIRPGKTIFRSERYTEGIQDGKHSATGFIASPSDLKNL